ncbi:hypothetical protein WUBG_13907, partial [Wuchereria bancrofti]
TCLVHGLYHRDHHNTAVVETGRAVGEWYSFTHARCSEGKGRAVVGNFVLSARNSEDSGKNIIRYGCSYSGATCHSSMVDASRASGMHCSDESKKRSNSVFVIASEDDIQF